MALPTDIELQVVTPQRHVLQETVQSVELPGKDGYLGVLPGHAPLLTELGIGILTYQKNGQPRYLTIAHGYAEVLPDRVIVLAEISEKAEEVDVARTRESAEAARARLAQTAPGDEAWRHASVDLERSLVGLQAAARIGATHDGHH
ncbi:MAG TPA: F0F1 ATP synthase subunit epsilon [Lacipirellulaceae bacterium]|nr:F0F1 ATP synthase subunit epsilon [Lacipirellulaceae bacterium]